MITFLCVAFVYFLPTIYACKRKDAASIGVVNFFLGWTFVGWVACLAWAMMPEKK